MSHVVSETRARVLHVSHLVHVIFPIYCMYIYDFSKFLKNKELSAICLLPYCLPKIVHASL